MNIKARNNCFIWQGLRLAGESEALKTENRRWYAYEEGGINLYQYAANPLMWLDPLGLSCSTIVKLNRKLRALEKAQRTAVKVRNLLDGRIRYYDKEAPARNPGPTRGRSHVTKWDPKTGRIRSWEETYDHSGQINRVHPKMNNGEVLNLPHYPPTAEDIASGIETHY